MAKFQFAELVDLADVKTVRLGAGTGSGNNLTDAEVGKFVKLVAESRYDLCAQGNEIEGRIAAVEVATLDGYTIGSVQQGSKFMNVTFDGLQATPGTGTLAVGDYVVCGTIVAKGTAQGNVPAKVCKATPLTFATTPAVNFPPGSNLSFKWRVASLGSAGTGAVGTTGVIEYLD